MYSKTFKSIEKTRKNIAHTLLVFALYVGIYALHKYAKPFLHHPLSLVLLKAIIAAERKNSPHKAFRFSIHFYCQPTFLCILYMENTLPFQLRVYCMCFYLFAVLVLVYFYDFSSFSQVCVVRMDRTFNISARPRQLLGRLLDCWIAGLLGCFFFIIKYVYRKSFAKP